MGRQSAGAGGEKNTQEQALIEAFQKFDNNGDGTIEKAEFVKLMKNVGGIDDKEINQLFSVVDSNSDGGINWAEFVSWICGKEKGGIKKEFLGPNGCFSFDRLSKAEMHGEAAFIREKEVSSRVEAYLKEKHRDEAMNEDAAAKARKQNQFTKSAGGGESSTASHNLRKTVQTSEAIDLGEDYDGYRLALPVTTESAVGYMQHLIKHGTSKPLHVRYVNELLTRFTAEYGRQHQKPVVEMEIPKGDGHLVVVGDTHGQLSDVLYIFHQLGCPSEQNMYLFNGDIADRGQSAVEIFLLLAAFFLADPKGIVINRGNHENEDMNALDADAGGGFLDEALRKYGIKVYRRFVSAFKVLSLCTIIQKECFVVHGGLTRVKTLTIEYLNTIDYRACTTPEPTATSVKEQVFSDLLWSDPMDNPGKYRSDRGVGITFGPDVTEKFCEKNVLRYMIRSHQLPHGQRGFMKHHSGRCITIFSASNYCGNAGNYGAVLVFKAETFPKYAIYEHYAPPLESLAQILGVENWENVGKEHEADNRENLEGKRVEKELDKMVVAIIEHKPELWAHLMDVTGGTDMVDVDTFEDVCTEITSMELQWKLGVEKWGLVNANGELSILKALSRFNVHLDNEKYTSFKHRAIMLVYESILNLDMNLQQTFALFDKDGDGTVDMQELRQVLSMFDLGLTLPQLNSLIRSFFDGTMEQPEQDKNVSKINVSEFFDRFTVVYKHAGDLDGSGGVAPWVAEALGAVGRLIISTPISEFRTELEKSAMKIQAVFRGKQCRDKAKDEEKEGEKSSSKIKFQDTGSQSTAFGRLPSSNTGGTRVTSSMGDVNMVAGRTEDVKGTAKMRHMFEALDVSGDGLLQLEEFADGLAQLPGLSSIKVKALEENGVEKGVDRDLLLELAKAVDTSASGTINYLEFLQAFSIEDAKGGGLTDMLAEHITTLLFRHRQAIRVGCTFFDKAGCGQVHRDDFLSVLEGVNSAISRPERQLTFAQLELLVEAAGGEDGVVDYEEFIRCFKVVSADAN
eukprot:gnl/MRDRNA2_/MRDRNA2_96182_c0_seq1.p1 gnl/MRDRNA2_/MRDRNA2_96182_c0~~gnl/MRDRNA2_/MRDRNA2_96182_c0_seq1.p1  ORF type:complete len:1021 (-),score=236.76 gnl/MRDRNA2_/MRDRNA2_96182_c0_seq1:36-3098(-)